MDAHIDEIESLKKEIADLRLRQDILAAALSAAYEELERLQSEEEIAEKT